MDLFYSARCARLLFRRRTVPPRNSLPSAPAEISRLPPGCRSSRQKDPPEFRRERYAPTAVVRGTPLMLQLLVWYFGPYYLFGMSIRGYRFPAIIIGFAVNYACYFAEIFRGGIEAIPVGQYEAAEVLGYSKSQTFFQIILPQMIKTILPSMTNEVITLVKDTSMAFTLAYNEMFSLAKQIAASQTSFTPFVIAGIFYFVANYLVAFGMERIEKAFDYYH